MNGKAVIKNRLFTKSVVVIVLNFGSASHCWKKIIYYNLHPKLYVALGSKLYVALQYQCNINVTFPIITLTIYYSLFFQFFHLSF